MAVGSGVADEGAALLTSAECHEPFRKGKVLLGDHSLRCASYMWEDRQGLTPLQCRVNNHPSGSNVSAAPQSKAGVSTVRAGAEQKVGNAEISETGRNSSHPLETVCAFSSELCPRMKSRALCSEMSLENREKGFPYI